MLGQIVYCTSPGKLRVEQGSAAGLRVAQVRLDPERRWAGRRLKKAGRLLAGAGAVRVLVPEEFQEWTTLERYGLRRVDPLPFLRFHAAQLAVAALRRQGNAPEHSAVALRGARADRDICRAAYLLCPQVRDVCISLSGGGEALREELRWDYGVAVRPDFPEVPAAVRFHPGTADSGAAVLSLFPPQARLGELHAALPGLEADGTEPLPLLSALWEAGKVKSGEIEFT